MAAPERDLRRSARLMRSFLHEQTEPHRFYGALAEDSVQMLSEHVDLSGRTVVDIGAGPSEFRHAFEEVGAVYIPVDHDPTVPAITMRGGLTGDAERLPFRSSSVDVAFSSNVWEHLEHPEAAGDEMVRIVAPGGLIFLAYTNWLSPWGGHETSPLHWFGGEFAARRYQRRHGHPPKNLIGESLYRVSVRQGLQWATRHPGVDVVAARPRYLPDWARHVLRIPGLREVATWNLLLILRRR